jgi:hypothetical protein
MVKNKVEWSVEARLDLYDIRSSRIIIQILMIDIVR